MIVEKDMIEDDLNRSNTCIQISINSPACRSNESHIYITNENERDLTLHEVVSMGVIDLSLENYKNPLIGPPS